MRGDEFTQRGMTRSRSLLLADVLWLTLALGMGHLLELFLAHRRDHRLRSALELALGRLAALGGQRRAGGFLLGCGFGWHIASPVSGCANETLQLGEGFVVGQLPADACRKRALRGRSGRRGRGPRQGARSVSGGLWLALASE